MLDKKYIIGGAIGAILTILIVVLFFKPGGSSNPVFSGSLKKEDACAIANAYLKSHGGYRSVDPQGPDKECKNFDSGEGSAEICVGGTGVIFRHYQEEGWKAFSVTGSCE